MDSIRVLFRRFPWGIKRYQNSQNANPRQLIEGVIHPFLDTIKWEQYQMDPIWILLRRTQSPLRRLHFQDIKKANFRQ